MTAIFLTRGLRGGIAPVQDCAHADGLALLRFAEFLLRNTATRIAHAPLTGGARVSIVPHLLITTLLTTRFTLRDATVAPRRVASLTFFGEEAQAR